jgi:hypothetical protein
MQLLFSDLQLTYFLVCSLKNCLQQVTQVPNKCSHISSEKASVHEILYLYLFQWHVLYRRTIQLITDVVLKICMQGRGGDRSMMDGTVKYMYC